MSRQGGAGDGFDDDGVKPNGKTAHNHPISAQTRKRLGVHLRAMYDSVLQQPVPDHFATLIANLDSQPPAKAPSEA